MDGRMRRRGGGWASVTRKYACVCVCARVGLHACAEGGPELLMYSHIMLGSDPAAVSKMFEAQNIFSEKKKCSHRLASLFLERPDIWPFCCSPSATSIPSSLLLSWFGGGLKAGAEAQDIITTPTVEVLHLVMIKKSILKHFEIIIVIPFLCLSKMTTPPQIRSYIYKNK